MVMQIINCSIGVQIVLVLVICNCLLVLFWLVLWKCFFLQVLLLKLCIIWQFWIVFEVMWVMLFMVIWIFLFCLWNLWLVVVIIIVMIGRIVSIIRVSFQFIYSRQRNRKIMVRFLWIIILMVFVVVLVIMVMLKVMCEIRWLELCVLKQWFGSISSLLNRVICRLCISFREILVRKKLLRNEFSFCQVVIRMISNGIVQIRCRLCNQGYCIFGNNVVLGLERLLMKYLRMFVSIGWVDVKIRKLMMLSRNILMQGFMQFNRWKQILRLEGLGF